MTDERCESKSPICKFDTGPVQCQAKKGHGGVHYGRNYDVSYEVAPGGESRSWDDEGRMGRFARRD